MHLTPLSLAGLWLAVIITSMAIDDFDPIVLGWVVACRDHHANGLAAKLPVPPEDQQTNTEDEALQEV